MFLPIGSLSTGEGESLNEKEPSYSVGKKKRKSPRKRPVFAVNHTVDLAFDAVAKR